MLAVVYIQEKDGMSQLNTSPEYKVHLIEVILTHSISEVFKTPQIFNFRSDS